MSMPISACMVMKAAKGDEDAYKHLIDAYTINLKCGHYTTFPCRCDPPCELPTEEQLKKLQARVDEYFEANPVKSDVKETG